MLVKLSLTAVLAGGMFALWPLKPLTQAQNLPSVHFIGQDWYELSPQEQSRALDNYRRFQKLPPERKRALEDRYHQWQQLPSEERDRLRRNYRRYRDMNSDQKEDFSRRYKHWRSQPHE
ncbi:MAG: DUF3106 domain-containing protein [Deltaproteobacteria bacterium]|nr:DUF3106 domain-containing protein [Deltaproteobacteria bacterium]